MDKSNRENTIKIKINGENQSFEEASVEKSNDEFTKVIQIDPEYIDQDSLLETAAAQESTDESFDWIIPESSDNEIAEYKIAGTKKSNKSPKKKPAAFSNLSFKRNGGPLKSIILTAVFAVLIGTSFGVLMLKLVITDGSKPAVTEPETVDKGTDNGTNKGSEEKPAGNTNSAVIGTQTVYVVQGGAFTSKDKAKDGATQAKGKGAPAATVGISEREHLFIGVADSTESAKELSGYYKENGFEEPFAKTLPIEEKSVSDLNESEKGFLEASVSAFQELSKVTASAISASNISDESIKAVTALEEQINKNADKIKNEKVKNLQGELSSAAKKAKSKDKDSHVEAQQHLLNFLSVYYSL